MNAASVAHKDLTFMKRYFVDDLLTKAILKSSIIYVFRLLFFTIVRRDFETPNTRYVFLTPPAFRRQTIYDRVLKRSIRFQVRNIDDLTTASQVFRFSSYETRELKRRDEILSLYKSILDSRKTPLIIDCGGNIGLASLFFSHEYHDAKIVCIEPDHSNIQQARLNNHGYVDFLEAAIGSEEGLVTIANPESGNNGFQVEKSENGTIKIVTLNDLLERYAQTEHVPFLLKVDIEGFESELFSAHTEWIDKFPVIMIELHDWMLPNSASTGPFLRAIGTRNRDFIIVGESIFSISNHGPN